MVKKASTKSIETVISIREDPFPLSESLEADEQRVIRTIRRNLVTVFCQLSKAYDSSNESVLNILPVRKRVGESEEETQHRASDSPGLLFYYLFEDWFSAFNLVMRREHRYAAELNKIVSKAKVNFVHIDDTVKRMEMFVKPELRHIERLHHMGRQLAVLKRIYLSYDLLIDRILDRQEVSLASLKNSHIVSGPDSLVSSHQHLGPDPVGLLGVSLSSAARVRFARLKNNLRLYAVSEIQECIDQKDSMVTMVSSWSPIIDPKKRLTILRTSA
jgi:hypothetical protein